MALNIKFKEIRKDWEKLILGVVAFIDLVLLMTFVINTFFYDEPQPELNVSGSPPSSIFNENAFAFLYGVATLEDEEVPFNFRKPFYKPKIKRPPRNNTNSPPPSKPEKKGHIVHYNGWITLSKTGKKLAFIKIHDFKTGSLLKSDSVEVGSNIFGYKVLDIDDEKVIIEAPNGTEKEIPIHKKITIIRK